MAATQRRYAQAHRQPLRSPLRRFEAFLDKQPGPSGCWLWTGYPDASGRGSFNAGKGKTVMAHRWAWLTWVGSIPSRAYAIVQRCKDHRCCQPRHLRMVLVNPQPLAGTYGATLTPAASCPRLMSLPSALTCAGAAKVRTSPRPSGCQ